jgi:hypothetical protein
MSETTAQPASGIVMSDCQVNRTGEASCSLTEGTWDTCPWVDRPSHESAITRAPASRSTKVLGRRGAQGVPYDWYGAVQGHSRTAPASPLSVYPRQLTRHGPAPRGICGPLEGARCTDSPT